LGRQPQQTLDDRQRELVRRRGGGAAVSGVGGPAGEQGTRVVGDGLGGRVDVPGDLVRERPADDGGRGGGVVLLLELRECARARRTAELAPQVPQQGRVAHLAA